MLWLSDPGDGRLARTQNREAGNIAEEWELRLKGSTDLQQMSGKSGEPDDYRRSPEHSHRGNAAGRRHGRRRAKRGTAPEGAHGQGDLQEDVGRRARH